MTVAERAVVAVESNRQQASRKTSGAPLVAVDSFSVGFRDAAGGAVPVLRDVSFTLQPGEQLGIVGESGCGKSTLALALLGHLRPNGMVLSGSLRVAERDPFALSPPELGRLRGGVVALAPQSASLALTPTMRVGHQIAESVTLHTALRGRAVRERVEELLATVHLPDPAQIARRYPHQLSGGQQQRVAIAVALAGEPAVLVLDEPTTGLDTTTQAALLTLLGELRMRSGVSIISVSHDLGVIARVAERLLVMYAGEVVEEGEVAAVFARPAHPYTRGLLASAPRLSRPGLPAAMSGQAPRPGRWPGGCAFAVRCPLSDMVCREGHPELLPQAIRGGERAAERGRCVRCHHWERAIAGEGDAKAPRSIRGEGRKAPLNGRSEGSIVLALEGLTATYARPGLGSFLSQLRGQPEGRPAVAGISLELRRGETLALVGESGSGKSTIARLVAGLLAPQRGNDPLCR